MKQQYDVVIIGGGVAGIAGAVQSALTGARTLLIEKNGMLGGTLTHCGLSAPGLFDAWGRQIIAGIGWDLVRRTVEEGGGDLPDFSEIPERTSQHLVKLNRSIFAGLADETVLDSGCELLLHSMLAEARWEESEWALSICTKTGLVPIRGGVLIDCTGDASAVQIAGLDVERCDQRQPGTIIFKLTGYDVDLVDLESLKVEYEKGLSSGELLESDFGWGDNRFERFIRWGGGNATHVCGIDATTSQQRTTAELTARKLVMRVVRFLRRQPGFENLRVDYLAPECGIRETVTIRGRERITLDDYWTGRLWDDAVCYSFYPVDIHTASGFGVDKRPLPEGVVATIPRGAMIPEGARNLIAAGRHIAGDREAFSAYRVMATCMATGQAAGAMAALSVRCGVDPSELDIEQVRQLLREHGAIVPPDL